MRTTLDIDADVLDTAKELAAQRKQSVGRVISEVFRRNVGPDYTTVVKNGVHVFQRADHAKAVVTLEMVNELRDGD